MNNLKFYDLSPPNKKQVQKPSNRVLNAQERQLVVLEAIRDKPKYIPEIAKEIDSTYENVRNSVRRLIAKGLVINQAENSHAYFVRAA